MNEIKSFVQQLDDKPILVYGLGKSGKATVNALSTAGAKVFIGDDNQENCDALKSDFIQVVDLEQHDLKGFAYLVLSPGVPFTHPEPHDIVSKALDVDLEIVCDIELFRRIYPDIKTIGITGTNGKSTTSSLITHILNDAGVRADFGGNIGTAVFDLDIAVRKPEWLVLEMSSFQIDLCPTFRPEISVILNITPDHLDRHGSIENYADVKERLVEAGAHKDGSAVICVDDKYTKKMADRAAELALRKLLKVSTTETQSEAIYVEDGKLYDGHGDTPIQIGDISKLQTLKGIHNQQNAASAFAVAKMLGLETAQIWQGIESFPGLNHRQYLVRTINGVGYVNDSKSTNAASAAVALACQKNVYWIVGGRQKKTGLDGLESFFSHIKHAFLIGEATEEFALWFDQYGIEYTRCFNLETATEKAHTLAQDHRGQPGGTGVVLLSPACASFDQYKSFEERGNHFADLVSSLQE